MRLCTICKELRKDIEFSFRNKKKNIKHTHCKECQRAAGKKHYEDHKQEYKDRATLWVKNNPDLRTAISSEHASRIRTKNICTCCSRKDMLTYYMNRPKGYHIDHIKRLSKGGMHCIKNLQYLTASEHGVKSCKERYEEERL